MTLNYFDSVADILLWRDEKRTFTCFLTLALAFYWFFLCGRTFTSSAAQLLLLVSVILYGYGILQSKMWVLVIICLGCFMAFHWAFLHHLPFSVGGLNPIFTHWLILSGMWSSSSVVIPLFLFQCPMFNAKLF